MILCNASGSFVFEICWSGEVMPQAVPPASWLAQIHEFRWGPCKRGPRCSDSPFTLLSGFPQQAHDNRRGFPLHQTGHCATQRFGSQFLCFHVSGVFACNAGPRWQVNSTTFFDEREATPAGQKRGRRTKHLGGIHQNPRKNQRKGSICKPLATGPRCVMGIAA